MLTVLSSLALKLLQCLRFCPWSLSRPAPDFCSGFLLCAASSDPSRETKVILTNQDVWAADENDIQRGRLIDKTILFESDADKDGRRFKLTSHQLPGRLIGRSLLRINPDGSNCFLSTRLKDDSDICTEKYERTTLWVTRTSWWWLFCPVRGGLIATGNTKKHNM